MIINSESSQSEWLNWTGVENGWPCGFQTLDDNFVYGQFRAAAGAVQSLNNGVHFWVSVGVDGTATAIPLAGMLATHGQVRFYRVTPSLKQVDLINLGSYSANVHDYYYAADAFRSAEIRRDLTASEAGPTGIKADDVSYPGGGVGLGGATNVRQGLDALALRGLAGLPDTSMAPGPAVDQYRVVWNNAAAKFVLAQQTGQSGAEIVSLLNAELGGVTWQGGSGGGPGNGTITAGSNLGTGGALGLYKAAVGVQLQFYGLRGINGIVAQLNATTQSIDYSLDLSYADARYVKATALDDVAFTGAYASLSGLPSLGTLSAKNLIAFVDIVATAIASLAEAQAGTAPDKLMTPQRVKDAIASQTIPSTRSVLAGAGLSGGGALTANVTLNLGTPQTVSGASTNLISGGGHTHALAIDASDVIPAFGAVGAYGLVLNASTTVDWLAGGNIAGASILHTRISVDTGTGNSDIYTAGAAGGGTWRCMGQGAPRKAGNVYWATLGVRIA